MTRRSSLELPPAGHDQRHGLAGRLAEAVRDLEVGVPGSASPLAFGAGRRWPAVHTPGPIARSTWKRRWCSSTRPPLAGSTGGQVAGLVVGRAAPRPAPRRRRRPDCAGPARPLRRPGRSAPAGRRPAARRRPPGDRCRAGRELPRATRPAVPATARTSRQARAPTSQRSAVRGRARGGGTGPGLAAGSRTGGSLPAGCTWAAAVRRRRGRRGARPDGRRRAARHPGGADGRARTWAGPGRRAGPGWAERLMGALAAAAGASRGGSDALGRPARVIRPVMARADSHARALYACPRRAVRAALAASADQLARCAGRARRRPCWPGARPGGASGSRTTRVPYGT